MIFFNLLSKVSTIKTVKIISQQQVDLNNLIVKIVSIVLNEILESSEKNSMTVEYAKNSVTIKHNEENDYVFDGKHFLRNGVTEKILFCVLCLNLVMQWQLAK